MTRPREGRRRSTSGRRRIGVAVSDAGGVLASPRTTSSAPATAADHRRIAELVAEEEAERVVVGLPLSLDGSIGPAARRCWTRSRSWLPCSGAGRDL